MRNQAIKTQHNPDYTLLHEMTTALTPASEVTLLAAKIGVTITVLCRYLYISPKTVQRNGILSVLVADRLKNLEHVVSRAIEVMEDEKDGILWLKTPIYALGNRSPFSYLGTSDGIQRVLNLLGQIEWGLIA
jgi:putative toxin-antitoxin system antitoxin component (TIGR02293 family)